MPQDRDLPDWTWPGGPHLNVGVYRPRLTDQESLVASLHAFLGLGAVLKGVGTAPAHGETFESTRDLNMQPISSSDELEPILADPTQRIFQFYTEGYFESTSVVSLSPISDEAARTDRHPVDVFFEATDFEVGSDDDRARIGDLARRLLLELARSSEVAYGTIVGEGNWLESPTELANENSSAWFGDFVLTNWVDAEDRDLVLAAFQGAYVEQLEFGMYVSTDECLNPRRMGLQDGWAERTALVRQVLAKNLA